MVRVPRLAEPKKVSVGTKQAKQLNKRWKFVTLSAMRSFIMMKKKCIEKTQKH